MKSKAKPSKNVETAVPFTAAQKVSVDQAHQRASNTVFEGATDEMFLPGMAPLHKVQTPFDILRERMAQDTNARAFGLGDVQKKIDQAAARDKMKVRQQKMTRWGNAMSDENGNIVPREILRKGSR